MSCEECKRKDKRLQVIQSDTDFQLKKMSEDLAQEKVLFEMQYLKENKRLIEKYHKEKSEREDENKKWISKYDSMVAAFQKTISELQNQNKIDRQSLEKQLKRLFQVKEKEQRANHENHVDTLKKEHQHVIFNMKEHQNKELKMLQKHQTQEIKRLELTHFQKSKAMKEEYEAKLLELRNQISEITQNRNSLKKEACEKQTSLYNELYDRKEEISSLKYQIDHLNISIKNYEEEIRFKNLEIEVLNQKHEEKIKEMNDNFEEEKTRIIGDFNDKIEQLLMKKLEDCQKFEENVKILEEKRQNIVKINQEQLKEVKVVVDQRPSRNEDLEQIIVLKEMLSQKEKEVQKIMEDMKSYKLELDYKESTFNRLFPSSSSQNILNIQKLVGKKKEQNKNNRSSVTLLKEQAKMYSTIHSFGKPGECKKERLQIQIKSSKIM